MLIAFLLTIAAPVENLTPQAFKALAEKKPGIVLDVRTKEEIARGKLKDATTIDFRDPRFLQKAALMQKDKAIYVYCAMGGRSSKAAEKLAALGFEHVYNLDGGITAWAKEGLPVEVPKEPPPPRTDRAMAPEAFDALVQKAPRVLVEFQTEWCTPCQKMEPVVAALKAQKNFTIVQVDVEQSEALAAREKVQAVPVFVLYVGGKERWRKVGEVPQAELEAAWRTKP